MQYDMIDVNSDQYKQAQQRLLALRTQVVLWTIVLALGITLIPLMLISSWVQKDVRRLEAELLAVQSSLVEATTPGEEVMRLGAETERINQLVSTIQTATLPSGLNWPQVVGAIVQFDPAAIKITALAQSGDRIEIFGRAASNDAVVRYQEILLNSGIFRDVVVISMSAVPPPAPTPEDEEAATTKPADGPLGAVEFVINLVVRSSAS